MRKWYIRDVAKERRARRYTGSSIARVALYGLQFALLVSAKMGENMHKFI